MDPCWGGTFAASLTKPGEKISPANPDGESISPSKAERPKLDWRWISMPAAPTPVEPSSSEEDRLRLRLLRRDALPAWPTVFFTAAADTDGAAAAVGAGDRGWDGRRLDCRAGSTDAPAAML